MTKIKSLIEEFPHVIDRAYAQFKKRRKTFYFYTTYGNYTGESAQTLDEFLDKVAMIDLASLEFHLYGGDFEKWMIQKGYTSLGKQLQQIRAQELKGEQLRFQISKTVSSYLSE